MSLRIKEEELELVGIDGGGSEILHYQGKPFTGIMYATKKDGSLAFEIEFQNGYREGLMRYYYPNGQLEEEWMEHNNIPVPGTATYYDENGNITYQEKNE